MASTTAGQGRGGGTSSTRPGPSRTGARGGAAGTGRGRARGGARRLPNSPLARPRRRSHSSRANRARRGCGRSPRSFRDEQGEARDDGCFDSSVRRSGRASRAPDFAGGTLVCKCADHPVKVTDRAASAPTTTSAAARSAGSPRARCSRWSRCGARQAPRHRERRQAAIVDSRRRSSATPAGNAASTCTAGSRTRAIRSTASISSTPSCARSGAGAAEFAAFVSSIIESGTKPAEMAEVRAR